MENKCDNFENKCTNCGLCRNVCPAVKALRDESVSPRAKNNLSQKFFAGEEKVDGKYFYEYCNGCGACVEVCPIKLGFNPIKIREKVVESGFVSEENKKMVENIKKYRNPFGDDKEAQKDSDKLYCC